MSPAPDAPRFFTEQPLSAGDELALETGPSRHIASALRLREGTPIRLFNGAGGEYLANISAISKQTVTVAVSEFFPEDREASLPITLGVGISRGERMDLVVQKGTELGVAAIQPLVTERTEVRLKGEREQKKVRHWQQVAISACEQCGRNRLPAIAEPAPLARWLEGAEAELKLVLHHRSDQGLAESPAPASVALLVGPEGGLSAAEIEAAEVAGFQPLTLGPRVLRTETAPLAALSILQFYWGDMQ
ncbi:MAG: 16S rRNA (uracil(1498)-N(3))-methyltransferase [Halieaceae bacterium]|nr:16S rRNA (uracil(1498)-N(3))-methyltransferase [Halieaceae bacterium]